MRPILSRFIPAITLLPLTIVLLPTSVLAETLKTENFRITISNNCSEGSVTCNDITYVGQELKTGSSIRLKGKTLNLMCRDRVTPCRFIGYEFRNKNYRYLVTEDGRLQVYRSTKLILDEKGAWEK